MKIIQTLLKVIEELMTAKMYDRLWIWIGIIFLLSASIALLIVNIGSGALPPFWPLNFLLHK